MTLRRLGVYTESLPTKKSRTVSMANFTVGGLIGSFSRRYAKAFPATSERHIQEIFGTPRDVTKYGYDSANLFFANAMPSPATLWVKSHTGWNGTQGDGVPAKTIATDGDSIASLSMISAYKGEYDLSSYGNSFIVGLEQAARFETEVVNNLGSTISLQSVAGIRVGDDVLINTGGNVISSTTIEDISGNVLTVASIVGLAVGDKFQIITSGDIVTGTIADIDAGNYYVTISSTDDLSEVEVGDAINIMEDALIFGNVQAVYTTNSSIIINTSTVPTIPTGSILQVLGVRLQTFTMDKMGIITEMEKDLGKVVCSLSEAVTEFYIGNVHRENRFVKPEYILGVGTRTAESYNFSFLDGNNGRLSGGEDGSLIDSAAGYSQDLIAFDGIPIRMIANCESTNIEVQKAIEVYCRGRDDMPKTVYNIMHSLSKDQLIRTGNNYQRSDDVLGVICAQWGLVNDIYANSINAPLRRVPNVGAVMGAWIRSITQNGIHFIPATMETTLRGFLGVVGDQFVDDLDRTDLANAGINVIQERSGFGFQIRNFFTPSTTQEFQFANGILMREFIKISVRDSLIATENEPNTFKRIEISKDMISMFMYRLWMQGSTGQAPTGETFGQSMRQDGSQTSFDDHVEIVGDIFNNPQDKINAGERNFDIWFTYPTPAGSIRIGVGLKLL